MDLLVFVCCLVRNVIYGSSILFTGRLTESVNIFDILALRFLMSFVVLWLLKTSKILNIKVGVRELLAKNSQSTRKPFVKTILLAAIFEPVLYMLFETTGISMTSNIMAGTILALAPIFSCISEELILGEKSSWIKRIFLGIGIVGVLYITVNTNTADGKNTIVGILFVLLAVISGCVYSAFSRKASKAFAPIEVTYVSCLLGTVVFNTVNIVRHLFIGDVENYFAPYFNLDNMVGFVFLAVLSTIVATLMGNYTLKKIQLSSNAAFGGISTLVTVILGVAFNSENLYFYHIIGFSLIFVRIIGVMFVDRKSNRPSKQNTARGKREEWSKI